MSKEKPSKVPVQRGPVRINEPTYKWAAQTERVRDAQERIRGNKDRETMEYISPRQ